MRTTDNPFPIYDRLVTSGLADPSDRPTFVDARPAFDIVTKNKIETAPDAGNFGPVIPPYDNMWLEGEDHSVYEVGPPLRFAVRVRANTPVINMSGSSYEHHVMDIFTQSQSGLLQQVPIRISYTVDEEGRLDEFMRAVDPEDVEWFQACPEEDKRNLTTIAQAAGIAGLFALSLMHSRNVKTPAATYTPAKRRKTSRQRPSIEYHTIQLPKPKVKNSAKGEATGTTKLHTARGHFKTYTAEAPLLGQHVGTYYWGWQVRGRKTNGEIISSYKVGV